MYTVQPFTSQVSSHHKHSAYWVLGTNSLKDFPNMTQRSSHLLKKFYNVPPLSAIVHESNVINFEDGFLLPSSCHSRTWLLDNFHDTCRETTSCKVSHGGQELCTEDSCVQSACLPRVVQMACSNSRPCERTACQSRSSSAVLECVSQPRQSGSSQQMGFIAQSCQPVSNMAKSCPPKTYVSKSCQTLECDSSQCQSQSPESSSCSPPVCVAPEPQPLESSSNAYEPTCCVTGGLQLPSK
ncbi:LOW QUALITY PROTEIN: keratin-associated protein 27-1 [Hippopotamus amphibius kiboko]|uniref:LOW QUALITY PROTEIN: keratin-associated protein 27-1 n=1 Tax=Hippopotamus amphibius kiboko TaxID=575201 RepID=UPI00259317B8|nr:LOW QUALITY PROTEIN: keratin-associated protein 27-1 [Hippopotamus amphibius kiboko]